MGPLPLIVTPQTVLRRHRDIVRRRWADKSRHKHFGRPRTHHNTGAPVLPLAKENPGWGYRRIHGEPAGLGIVTAPSTVWEILLRAGIPPAPRRSGPTWTQLLHNQARAILATDFFTLDLLDGTSAHVLAVIEHATRRIRILGVTAHPNDAWVTQMARNLLTDLDEHLESIKFLLRDHDTKFTTAFDAVFLGAGIRTLAQPHPNTPGQRDHETLDRWPPTRTPRPDIDLEPAAPTHGPPRVRGPPQPAPPAPFPKPSRTPQTAARSRH